MIQGRGDGHDLNQVGSATFWCLENDDSAAEGRTIDAAIILRLCSDTWLGQPFLENPNARLIAAAPDLLAACQKALDECCDLISTPAGDALVAAIARATNQ